MPRFGWLLLDYSDYSAISDALMEPSAVHWANIAHSANREVHLDI